MIYLDYAATSLIKPFSVYNRVYETMTQYSANPGRGGHDASVKAGELVYNARETICDFFSIKEPEQLAFFSNTTAALNAGIKGVLRRGDHVVVSSMEHNSVLRPLEALRRQGIIQYTIVQADSQGQIDPNQFIKAMTPKTKLVLCTHVSNVCGNIYDIHSISRLVHKKNVYFMVDAAQSAGSLNIHCEDVDLLAFPGHKGLYGPQGSGGLYVRKGIELQTITEGGTGSQSELLVQPDDMPDRLESGTLNVPAIVGLGAAVEFIKQEGIQTIRDHEKNLTEIFREKVKNMPGVTVYGDDSSCNVVALNVKNIDSVTLAEMLNKKYHIAVRSGLHCAPSAHKSLGTIENGCVRFSFGYFTTMKEIMYATDALYNCILRRE